MDFRNRCKKEKAVSYLTPFIPLSIPRPFDKLRVLSPSTSFRINKAEAQAHFVPSALSARQDGDSSTTLTVPEQGRRERSRTVKWRGGGG